MAAFADAIEMFLQIFTSSSSSRPACEPAAINAGIMICYTLFAFGWLVVWTKFSDKDFSSILTCSAVVQLMGFLILTIKVRASKSVAGISSKTLEMYAVFFLTRLSSTLVKSGYIPVDRSGRNVYQLMDLASFFVVIQLLVCVHKTYRWTYQAENDSMSMMPLLPPCVVLAVFIHADLNRSPFFDTVWAVSTNVDTLAMLPQLWMMNKVGGEVEGCTAHFTAAMVLSRVLALAFWATAYADLVDDGSHLAAKMIVVANGVQLLLAADFLYYYAKATWNGTKISLPEQRLEDI